MQPSSVLSYQSPGSVLDNIYADPTQSDPTQAAQPQQQPKGNFFTHALPTIGGILGGLGGELLGPIGGIAGAGGGSALGKVIENKLEGKGAGDDVLENAAEGSIGQGVGGAVGKVAGKVMGAVGSKSGAIADNLVKGQVTKGAISSDAANTLRTMGATDARQWQPIAEQITGQGGAINRGVESGLMSAEHPGVEVSDLIGAVNNPGMAEDLINNETALGSTAGKKVLGTVNKAVQNMLGGNEGMVGKQVADPLDALQQSRLFSKLAAKAQDTAYRTQNAEQQAVANVYKGLSDELNQRIFSPGGVSVPLSDEAKAGIIQNLGGVKDINPTVHNNLVSQIQGANTLEDLRGIQAPFVQGSQAVDATARAADRGAGTNAQQVMNQAPLAGAMAGGPHGLLAGISAMALRSPTADRAMVPLISNGGRILSQVGDSSLPAKVGAGMGVLSSTSNNLIQNGGTVEPMNPQLAAEQPVQTGATNSPAGGLSRDDLITLALYSPSAFNSILGAAAPQQQQVAAANQASTALTGLGNAPGGGILSQIEGKLGFGAAGEYQRKAQSAAEQVAAALPGTDPKAIEKQLTDYAAGGGNIDEAIQSLLERLSSVVNNNKNGAYQSLMNYQGGSPSIMGQMPVAAAG